MKKIYFIFLLLNLALSQAGGGGSDSGYDGGGYDGGGYDGGGYNGGYIGGYDGGGYDGGYFGEYDGGYAEGYDGGQDGGNDGGYSYDSGFSSSYTTTNSPPSVIQKVINFVVVSVFLILIIVIISIFMMPEKMEWTRFVDTKILLPANYDIEEAKQLYTKTRWSIVFKQKQTLYDSEVLRVVINNTTQQSPTHELKLWGKDNFGSWSAQGFISFNQNIIIQFKKIYDNREKAGQTGKWRNLYYQGEMVSAHLIEGIWFYKGFELDATYSGTFTLRLVD